MTQVKVFSAINGDVVEELINNWLSERKLISIIDIKWSITASRTPIYSAMVIYQCGASE